MTRMLVARRAFAGLCVVVGVLLLAPVALAAGPATSVAVSLSPPSIPADGASNSTATAKVTDASGTPVVGDTINFATDGGQTIGAVTDHGDGTYTATVTSSTTPGSSTITATDTSVTPNVSGTATLTQFGPAAHLALTLAPSSIPADGASNSTATAKVTDANGNPVVGDTINFATDGGQTIGAVTDHGDGTYTATITSTTTVGSSTITATDITPTPNVTGTTTLTQTQPATTVTVSLSPPSIPADGVTTSTAKATVKDASGNPVAGDTITFASDGGQTIGAVTDHGDGTYTATITSTTTVGSSTITATDITPTPNVTGTTTLTQTQPATTVAVSLSPSSIVANGSSTTLATATVTDARRNPVGGHSVVITTSSGQTVQAANRGDGTYAAQVHSTTRPGQVTVTATDQTSGASGHAQLTQTAGASTTSLGATPGAPVTNEVVTVVAKVTTGGNPAPISGSVTFANFGGPVGGSCSGEPVSSAKPTVTCRVSFSADASPEQLTATFTPDANSGVAGSTGRITLPIGGDSTSTSLGVATRTPAIRRSTTYTAIVKSLHSGFAQPAGSVQFRDGAKAISGCTRQRLSFTNGANTATCSVKYRAPGTHRIVARYLGDRDFKTSSSSATKVRALRAVTSKLSWSFKSTRAYTSVTTLRVTRAPAGSKVVTVCHGRGCPFARHATAIKTSQQGRSVDLSRPFNKRRLSRNARVAVEILRTNWIGKYYGFVVRSGRAPSMLVSCLVPGSAKPGVGCQA